MTNSAAIMKALLLTLLVFIQVSGVPLPGTIPTEITPLGSSAPVICPRPPVTDEPDDNVGGETEDIDTIGENGGTTGDAGGENGADTDDPVQERPPCTDLDLSTVLNSALEPLIKSSTEELYLSSVSNLISVIDAADTTPLTSDPPNIQEFTTSLTDPINGALEGFTPVVTVLDQDDFRVEVRSAVVEYIQDGSYNCQINIGDVDTAIRSYIESDELRTLTDAAIADASSQVESVVATALTTTVNAETLTPFSSEITQLVSSNLDDIDLFSPVLDSLVTVPLEELPTDTSVVTSIIVTNLFIANAGSTRRKRQAVPDVEIAVIESVSELTECTICEITKNSIDEVIVQAVSGILQSTAPPGVITEENIQATVSDTVTNTVIEKSFSDSVSSSIGDDSLREKVLEAIVTSLATTDSSTIIDTNTIQSSIDSLLQPEILEETVTSCVDKYLSDSPAIENAITNAVINAVVRKEVNEDVISSISVPDICEGVVSSIKSTLDTIDVPSVVSLFETALTDILSDILNDPAIMNIISRINGNYIDSILTPIFKKFKFSPNKFKTALLTVGGFVTGLANGIGNGEEISTLLSEIFSSLIQMGDSVNIADILQSIQDIQEQDSETSIPPTNSIAPITSDNPISSRNSNMFSKTLSKLKPLTATLLMAAKKAAKLFLPSSPVSFLARANRRSKRALLSKKVDFLRKLYGELTEAVSSVGDQLGEVGEWATKFPPVVKGYNAIRDFSLEDVRQDFVIFLSGFDFIDANSLENFSTDDLSLDALFSGIDVADLDSEVIFDYFASWEEYFDSMAADAIDNIKSFDKNIWKFKKSLNFFQEL